MKKKFVLIGSGNLAGIIAGAYADGRLPDYEMLGVLGIEKDATEVIAAKAGCRAMFSLSEAISLKPDYMVEAASVEAVKAYLPEGLSAGISFVTLSIGTFADAEFYAKAKETASENDAKIYFPSGAVGGFDVLRTITTMGAADETGTADMEFTMNKSRLNMMGTSLYDKCPAEGDPVTIFEGSASEAIEVLPGHVNVAVAEALATVGSEEMKVRIYSDPNELDDVMISRISAEKASAELTIRSVPADIAAWSVVALLNNLASPIQFA